MQIVSFSGPSARGAGRRHAAFTLVELVIVLAIISLLAGVGIYMLTGTLADAKRDRVPEDIRAIEIALTRYEARNFQPPTTEQGLKALVTKPDIEPLPERWSQCMEEVPKDPWGREYGYERPGKRSGKAYDIFSLGEDGVGSDDDVGNWKKTAEAN